MKLDDIQRPLIEVAGWPQLRVVVPMIDEMGEISDKFEGYNPADDETTKSAEATLWFFQKFVRDQEGALLEGMELDTIHSKVPNTLLKACIDAVVGSQPALDESPPD